MKSLVGGMIVLSALLGCTTPEEPELGPADVTVELDAFSGLPNPSWTLSAAEAGELAARLRGLPRASASQLPEPVLGYRGFWIRNPNGEGGIPQSVYVSRGGLIQVTAPGGTDEFFRDQRKAEEWLITLARQRGYEGAFHH